MRIVPPLLALAALSCPSSATQNSAPTLRQLIQLHQRVYLDEGLRDDDDESPESISYFGLP
jgi:hypothetical protein